MHLLYFVAFLFCNHIKFRSGQRSDFSIFQQYKQIFKTLCTTNSNKQHENKIDKNLKVMDRQKIKSPNYVEYIKSLFYQLS